MVAYSFKRRFVEPIKLGLGLADAASNMGHAPKRQTIRSARRRHARPGEEVQLYCGMRTKGCFMIGVARCTDVVPIRITFGWASTVRVGANLLQGRLALDEFARKDGFPDWGDMRRFWREENDAVEEFEGVVIRWLPLFSEGET